MSFVENFPLLCALRLMLGSILMDFRRKRQLTTDLAQKSTLLHQGPFFSRGQVNIFTDMNGTGHKMIWDIKVKLLK